MLTLNGIYNNPQKMWQNAIKSLIIYNFLTVFAYIYGYDIALLLINIFQICI